MRLGRISLSCAATLAATAAVLAVPGHATAAPAAPCPTPAARHIQGLGALIESAAVDSHGRLYAGDLLSRKVWRIDSPGATPKVFATINNGTGVGGVAIGPSDTVYVGGTNAAALPVGDTAKAGTINIFTSSGRYLGTKKGFSATSGLTVAADGTTYATNDLGTKIGRLTSDGTVRSTWAQLPSANGGVLSPDGKWLYVSRSFVNPGVSKISTADPRRTVSVWTAPAQYAISSPDGLTLDAAGRPIVPMNATGQIVRVEPSGRSCVLATGLLASTQVLYGRGRGGFAAGHLYRVGFDGQIWEVTSGRQ